ncbi:MAG TPA: hypothetical protein VI911_07625 [Patescibacteria group bacterium]|nr:hypothetical protein [Patescibacteria group bacterium]
MKKYRQIDWKNNPLLRIILYTTLRKELGVYNVNVVRKGKKLVASDKGEKYARLLEKLAKIFELLLGYECSKGAIDNQVAWAVSKQIENTLHRSHVKVKTVNKTIAKMVGFLA